MRDDDAPALLKIPGLRRYAAEIRRLRQEARSAQTEIEALRSALEKTSAGEEWLRQAKEYEYYWSTAFKKIDIRQTAPFGELAARIIGHGRTYLDFDRLYTLWQLVEALPRGSCAVAEVGAYRGGSARFIAEALRLHDREPALYVCDTFHGHTVVDGSIDGLHRPGEQFRRTSAQKVAAYLSKFPFARVVEGDICETASQLAGERAFGLVHIDVDVYPITQFCLDFFAPRVISGGTILVDDYGTTTCLGVKKAVDEFVGAHEQFRRLHLLTGQAILTHIHAAT